MTPPLVIVQDVREQFEVPWSEGVVVERARLPVGNYSARGVTDVLAVEVVWSLDDITARMGPRRERFEATLLALHRYRSRIVIIAVKHDDHYDLANGVCALACEYRIPLAWSKNPEGATRTLEWHARRAVERRRLN